MIVKTCVAVLIAASSVSNVSSASDVNWSTSTLTPINDSTIRAYGLKYAPTPQVLYNVDFFFNEGTLQFAPDMSTLITVDIAKYAEADIARGGSLYDKWWKINREDEPGDTYSSYPEVGSQTGSTTWRCKECHGWDYKGDEGAYESGSSHYTGINGIYQLKNKPAAEIYSAISRKHLSLSEQDIWDLTKFLKEGLVDMNKYIIFTGTQSKSATGDVENGRILFEGAGGCLKCHGEDGNKIAGVSVGAVVNENPWEGLHKIRFGQPGTNMPSAVKKGLLPQDQIDILTYAQTLPQVETEHH
jgi:thiosulfate dehydrogenase